MAIQRLKNERLHFIEIVNISEFFCYVLDKYCTLKCRSAAQMRYKYLF